MRCILAQATQDERYLTCAHELTGIGAARSGRCRFAVVFVGPAETDGVSLVTRPVSLHDSAIPSGVSVMCQNLLSGWLRSFRMCVIALSSDCRSLSFAAR